jgi:hypothetical protein
MTPWSPPAAPSDISRAGGANRDSAAAIPLAQDAGDPATTDMAGVLDKLAQVRAMDPAAEEKLLAELRRTPASSWPLVAEQFRASLAYHQQLVARPPKTAAVSEPMAAFERHLAKGGAASDEAESVGMSRPSSAIGRLVDPQGASTHGDAIVAQTMPYAMPRPIDSGPALPEAAAPAEFAASGPMYPISGRPGGAIETAALEVPAPEAKHVATQAVAISATESAADSHPMSPIVPGDDNWQQNVQEAAEVLSRRVTPSPSTTAEVHQHVSLRVLRLLAGDTEQALEPIPHIPPAEQDYWSRQIFALATYLDHHSQPDDKRRAAASVVHLDQAVSHLRELGSLSLRNLSFCQNVYGYGAFEPYDSDVFAPGEQVSLYVEVENYHSESNEKGYCTLLGATYEILDDKGKRVSGGDFPDVDDCCRSRRRDFHIQFGLALPKNLSPGRYRVELVVKDRQSDKRGHATVPFEIRGGRK